MTNPTPIYLTSPLLKHVPHAFTTRQGGYSSGMFSSLNFGNPGDLPPDQRDPADTIVRNQQLMLDALNCPQRTFTRVHQVHGCAITDVCKAPAASPIEHADALISDDPSRILSIRIADCAPILLATIDGKLVAAVHAGWRGMAQRICQLTVQAMQARSTQPIVAAIGPCIGPGAFEVGPEVIEATRAAVNDPAALVSCVQSSHNPGRFLLDLPGVLTQQLRESGVEQIDALRRCTVSESELFFSHRGHHGKTGRMAGLIGVA
jgi:polyphenol oxidase